MSYEDLEIRNNETADRFEATIDNQLAEVDYRRTNSQIFFAHTDVPRELEGQGIGSRLAKAALNYARGEGLEVVPLCPFIGGYIKRHPEYQEIVSEKYHDQ